VRSSSKGHKLGLVRTKVSLITQISVSRWWGNARLRQRRLRSSTVVLLETAFDEAWLTLKPVGNNTVKPDELARAVLHLAMEGERDPIRLSGGVLEGLLPATTRREAS